MATKTINTRIVMRNDLASAWSTANPVLLSGEIGVEKDTGKFKIGDGATTWTALPYAGTDEVVIENLIAENKDTLYQYTRTDAAQSDDAAITAALAGVAPVQGDVCVITTQIDSVNYEQSAFMYDGEAWRAMTGHVDADKVILTENITMAGNYTQVGNLTKSNTGTATFATKGKSVADAFTEIFSKRLQPTITANPVVTLNFSQAKAYEVGTSVTPSYTASLSAGSYTYGPATGITATGWNVVAKDGSSTAGTLTSASGSFDAITVGDNTKYGITATATHGAGTVAADNLGSDSDPVVQIAAGSKNKTSGNITGYRSFFYGVLSTSSAEAPLTSAIVRGLTNGGAYTSAKEFTVNANATAKRIVVAVPGNTTRGGLNTVILTSAMNTPVTDSYKYTVDAVEVEGVGGYTAIPYDVYVYEPAAIDAGEVHKISLK